MRVRKATFLKLSALTIFITFVVINIRDDGKTSELTTEVSDEGRRHSTNYSSQVVRLGNIKTLNNNNEYISVLTKPKSLPRPMKHPPNC